MSFIGVFSEQAVSDRIARKINFSPFLATQDDSIASLTVTFTDPSVSVEEPSTLNGVVRFYVSSTAAGIYTGSCRIQGTRSPTACDKTVTFQLEVGA